MTLPANICLPGTSSGPMCFIRWPSLTWNSLSAGKERSCGDMALLRVVNIECTSVGSLAVYLQRLQQLTVLLQTTANVTHVLQICYSR